MGCGCGGSRRRRRYVRPSTVTKKTEVINRVPVPPQVQSESSVTPIEEDATSTPIDKTKRNWRQVKRGRVVVNKVGDE